MAPPRDHLRRVGRAAACLVALAAGLSVGGSPAGAASTTPAATPTLADLIGQRLVVGMSGTHADASLLERIRAGHVGGVILFSSNISSPSQLAALTSSLQAAARAGGHPKLIICTDQEGGEVKRIPWAPPNLSAQQLGQLPSSRSQESGSATGSALINVGVNVDLAPVLDVPAGSQDFIEQQHRAFSTNRFTVTNDGTAFSQGLENGHVWPTVKHFPGLGLATVSTDQALVRINASRATIVKGLLPYKVVLRHDLHPIVMLSTAVYPAYDWRAAAWSPPIINGILRGNMGFKGVTMTDSLDSAAAVRHETIQSVAVRTAEAGTDLLLVTGSESESSSVYLALLSAANSGKLTMADLTASYNRIIGLKSSKLSS